MMNKKGIRIIISTLILASLGIVNAQEFCDGQEIDNFYVNEDWAPDYNWEPILPKCFLPYYGEVNLSYEYFRSLPEGSFEGNTGAYVSANFGLPILRYYCYDLGAIQFGASYGTYDWSGRASSFDNPKEIQQQAFVTVGYFRRTPGWSGINGGIVYDWMINKNMGVFALNPKISQVRAQLGYQFRRCNEYGIWGTLDVHTSRKSISDSINDEAHATFRAISQVNFFWTHTYENCAETTLWAGVPYKKSLHFNSSRAGQFIIGGSFRVPLACRFLIEGHGMYMRAKNLPGRFESQNYAANVCIGITYFFGRQTWYVDASEDWRPYLPTANNSNFITDTNFNF